MSRIKQLFSGIQDMGEGGDDLNPILQVPVLVTGNEGTVYIDIMPNEKGEEQQGEEISTGEGGGLGSHEIQNQMLAIIQSAVNSVTRTTINIRNEMRESNMTMIWQFGLMNRSIKWIALVPAQSGDHNQQQLQASMLVGDSPGDVAHDPAMMNSRALSKQCGGWRCCARTCSDELLSIATTSI